jgi:hypothetical protein
MIPVGQTFTPIWVVMFICSTTQDLDEVLVPDTVVLVKVVVKDLTLKEPTEGLKGFLTEHFSAFRYARPCSYNSLSISILTTPCYPFQPTPATLRADGIALASHLISSRGVESLVIHGESIGGVAASGTARTLSENSFTKEKLSLLICDRTFCNLEAVAQRLVGGWSAYAIRVLAPFWSFDVAGDFIASNCQKVVANDPADAIIADPSSLKAGIALWKEGYRGSSTTKGIGWMMEAPAQYRMADWENVPVNGKHSNVIEMRCCVFIQKD